MQLNITAAPAEFCLPMKNDRQFKPHFQVQVHASYRFFEMPLELYQCLFVAQAGRSESGLCTYCQQRFLMLYFKHPFGYVDVPARGTHSMFTSLQHPTSLVVRRCVWCTAASCICRCA